jgi:hypothetical protein
MEIPAIYQSPPALPRQMLCSLTKFGSMVLIVIALGTLANAAEFSLPCGLNPKDWCASPSDDPCGRHKNERECRADPSCKGMKYRGESVVACEADERGFWRNCPAVGCISR